MAAFDDDLQPQRKRVHEVGQDLSALSVEELGERVELLKAEVARLETEIEAKSSHRSAADQLFRL